MLLFNRIGIAFLKIQYIQNIYRICHGTFRIMKVHEESELCITNASFQNLSFMTSPSVTYHESADIPFRLILTCFQGPQPRAVDLLLMEILCVCDCICL